MTQILTLIRRGLVLHLSDRLLTTPETERVHDRRSNKSLVVSTEGSLGVVGYSGHSRVGDVLTDDWLAGAICSDPAGGWWPPGDPRPLVQLDSGPVATRLLDHLNKFLGSLNERERIDFTLLLQYCGYRWSSRRRRAIPFIFEITKPAGELDASTVYRRDAGESIRSELIVSTPRLGATAQASLEASLERSRDTEDGAWASLVEAMHHASLRSSVGDSFLGLRVTPLQRAQVVVRFETMPGGTRDTARVGSLSAPVNYVPWIISPFGIQPPMVMNMSSLDIGGVGFVVAIDPPPNPQLPIAMFAQGHDRAPTTRSPGEIRVTPRRRRANESMSAARHLDEVLIEHGIAPGGGATGSGKATLGVSSLPPPDSPEEARLIGDITDLGMRVILLDASSGRTLMIGQWSDDERADDLAALRAQLRQLSTAQQTLDLIAAMKKDLGVHIVFAISRRERQVSAIASINVIHGPPTADRARYALSCLCQLADELQITFRLTATAVAQHVHATAKSSDPAWTFEDLGFVATGDSDEPYRREPAVEPMSGYFGRARKS